MFDQLKRLFKHSAIYAVGSVAQSAVAFLLIPLYTRYLVPASYGRLEIVNTFGSILLMLITFGFTSALMKTYFRDAHNEEERRRLVGTSFSFVIPISFAIVAVLLGFAPVISLYLLGDAAWAGLFQILLVTTFFTIFMNMAFALLRVQERSKKYTVLFLLRFGVVLALNFYFIIWLKLDAAGVLWANLISFALVALSLLPDVLKSACWHFSPFLLRKLWAFGIAIVPASVAIWIMDLSDRYFIEIFRDPTEVGIYALGYKIGMIIDV
jgi:O-antigen/teichoic acid export membrane protein